MDNQSAGNAKPQQIQKCSYYDPTTRETVKPGKTCPDYNSTKGCPYAHPFEYDKWDGESPLNAFSILAPNSGASSSPIKDAPRIVSSAARAETDPGRMDVDEQPPQDSAPLELALVPSHLPETSLVSEMDHPPELLSLFLQKEAVSGFLTHIVTALHQYHTLNDASRSLTQLKSLYKGYKDRESQDLASFVPPGTMAAWITERESKISEIRAIEKECSDWLAGLASFDCQREPTVLQIEDGQDAMMADDATVAPVHILSKKDDLVVQALAQHRARLARGEVGERLVALRTRLERSRVEFQKKGQIRAPMAMEEGRLTDGDTEMKEGGNADVRETSADVIRKDIARLEELLTQSEDTGLDIDDAEIWATATLEQEWFAQGLRSAIERITREYLSRLSDGHHASVSTQGAPLSQRQGKLQELKQLGGNLEDIRFQCLTLEKILGPASDFDQRAISMLPDLVESVTRTNLSATKDLGNLLDAIDQRSSQNNSLLHSDRYSILQNMKQVHTQAIGEHPSIASGPAPPALFPRLPPATGIHSDQQEVWNREFEVLKEQVSKVVMPLVARTDAQEARLMSFGAERRTGAGTTGIGTSGGMQLSVQGAMG